MQIITVELIDENALGLLQQLEQLKVLRVISAEPIGNVPKRQWAGSLSKETGEKMLTHLDSIRSEWERNF